MCSFVKAEESSIGYDTVLDALQSLKENPAADFRDSDGWTVVNLQKDGDRILWTFTPEWHPAHPSAVKREVIERNGEVFIEMNVLCQSTKPECDQLVKEFEQLNDNIRQSMQQKTR